MVPPDKLGSGSSIVSILSHATRDPAGLHLPLQPTANTMLLCFDSLVRDWHLKRLRLKLTSNVAIPSDRVLESDN